ncbi:HD domain-containing protein [candidate division KSB1 bacterium]|nr:HD domain-containing protein [candidate division KSB1 bacterium]
MEKELFHNELFKTISKVANENAVRIYTVGGFVRDYILGHTSKDIDFVLEGDGPKYAKKLAKALGVKNLTVYKKFGTAMIKYQDRVLEFVGARKESYRENSRKPEVTSTDILTDLARRDFTVNAIAISLNEDSPGKVIDPYQGQKDIKRKIIRTPLDPEKTFFDDPLRIMRAVRFACQLDFKIDDKTMQGLNSERERLKIISQERITDELLKILASDKPSLGFQIMDKCGILPIILPEIAALKGIDQIGKHSHKDVFYHTIQVIDNVAQVSRDINLRLVALFHDVAKPATKQYKPKIGWTFHGHDDLGARMLPEIFKRLKLSNDMLKYTEKLVRLHLRPIHLAEEGVTDSAIRRLIFDAGQKVDDLLMFCRADITSANPKRVKQHLSNFDYVVERIKQVEEKDRLREFQPPVDGNEIMDTFNLQPGPAVGKLKKAIEEAILNGEIPNEHDAAFQYLLSIKDSVLGPSS